MLTCSWFELSNPWPGFEIPWTGNPSVRRPTTRQKRLMTQINPKIWQYRAMKSVWPGFRQETSDISWAMVWLMWKNCMKTKGSQSVPMTGSRLSHQWFLACDVHVCLAGTRFVSHPNSCNPAGRSWSQRAMVPCAFSPTSQRRRWSFRKPTEVQGPCRGCRLQNWPTQGNHSRSIGWVQGPATSRIAKELSLNHWTSRKYMKVETPPRHCPHHPYRCILIRSRLPGHTTLIWDSLPQFLHVIWWLT